MSLHELNLPFEAVGEGNIVSIHPRNVSSLGQTDSDIQ
jgi:hypothetical protein